MATGSTAFAIEIQALKEENKRLREALEHISRMRTFSDHKCEAHELANRALYSNCLNIQEIKW